MQEPSSVLALGWKLNAVESVQPHNIGIHEPLFVLAELSVHPAI